VSRQFVDAHNVNQTPKVPLLRIQTSPGFAK
jgi:hypothetical protein